MINFNNLNKDLIKIIYEFIFFTPRNNDILKKAVNEWCFNKNEALKKYGHISDWNTYFITDMSELFNAKNFNDEINNWNVSNVTNMKNMFFECANFNKSLDKWDVSNVTNMSNMFCLNNSFDKYNSLNNWDISNVEYYDGMFEYSNCFLPNKWRRLDNQSDRKKMFGKAGCTIS